MKEQTIYIPRWSTLKFKNRIRYLFSSVSNDIREWIGSPTVSVAVLSGKVKRWFPLDRSTLFFNGSSNSKNGSTPPLISNNTSTKEAEDHFREVLRLLDHDVTREGLLDTPKRYIKFLKQICSPTPFKFTVFDAEGYSEMITVLDIPFYSCCEHHLAPFFGVAHVSYVPNGKIVGLSKIPRCVEFCSCTLQNQERITSQIAKMIQDEINPLGVAVILEARHMCVEMRGCKKPGVVTRTVKMLGKFRTDKDLRNEFHARINSSKQK